MYKTKVIQDFYGDSKVTQDLYIRGDRLKPTYWLTCLVGGKEQEIWGRGCDSAFYYKDLVVEYYFRGNFLFDKHDELRKKIINKLDAWSETINH